VRRRGVTALELSDSETPVLEETYRELRLPLLRLTFLLTGSRETAEDVVQSAFASAQPRSHRIEDPPAYLRRSVVNLAKDGQRRKFLRRKLLRPQPEPVTSKPPADAEGPNMRKRHRGQPAPARQRLLLQTRRTRLPLRNHLRNLQLLRAHDRVSRHATEPTRRRLGTG
jgi:DNA-directed RNA polymerase specialized sigma24 family protein